MIAVDTNVLIHASRREMPLHKEALSALRALAEGDAAWALPVFCIGEYLRVVSHPRVFDPPTPVLDALESLGSLLESPAARLLMPSERYLPLLERLVRQSGASANLIFDAQIAALCLEYGARTLLTEDRDFSRFPELTVQPLVGFAWPTGG